MIKWNTKPKTAHEWKRKPESKKIKKEEKRKWPKKMKIKKEETGAEEIKGKTKANQRSNERGSHIAKEKQKKTIK